jgi:hypothetical protein
VVFLPVQQRRNTGSITAALGQLAGHPPFAEVAGLLRIGDDIDGQVRALVDRFAAIFITNATTPLGGVVFTHAVTVFAAVGGMAPLVSPPTARGLLRHAWQVAAALYAAYGVAPPAMDPPPAPKRADLVDRAVESGDDHVIKLTEACLTWASPDMSAPAAAAFKAAELAR